jgi:hypothetical protein
MPFVEDLKFLLNDPKKSSHLITKISEEKYSLQYEKIILKKWQE